MYTATILEGSPRLDECRKVLSKQRLQWEETSVQVASGETGVLAAAIQISVADVQAKLKAVRTARKKTVDPMTCVQQGDKWLWSNPETGYRHLANHPYDAARQAKIEREARARVDKRLAGNFTDCIGQTLGHNDFTPFYKPAQPEGGFITPADPGAPSSHPRVKAA